MLTNLWGSKSLHMMPVASSGFPTWHKKHGKASGLGKQINPLNGPPLYMLSTFHRKKVQKSGNLIYNPKCIVEVELISVISWWDFTFFFSQLWNGGANCVCMSWKWLSWMHTFSIPNLALKKLSHIVYRETIAKWLTRSSSLHCRDNVLPPQKIPLIILSQ